MDLVEVKYQVPDLPVAGSAVEYAKAITIDSQETYDFANEQLGVVKTRWKELDAARKTIVNPINAAKDAVQALFNPVLDDLASAEGLYKRGMLNYQQEQERVRKAEQAALDEDARKVREKLEKDAEKAEAKGHTEKAAVLAQTAAVISAPIATSTYVAGKGLSTKKIWKAAVIDKAAFIKSVAANPMFHYLVDAEKGYQGGLDKLARAMEGNVPLDGVKCEEEETLARRAA